nr:hypothetical protein [Methylobacterium phyllostachyos]
MTDAQDARVARLKAALRENLRRRKAQGRGRADVQPAPDANRASEDGSESGGPDSDKSRL